MHRAITEEKDEKQRGLLLDAMLQMATPQGHMRLWAHRKSCEWNTLPGQKCPCNPTCLLVLPAAFA